MIPSTLLLVPAGTLSSRPELGEGVAHHQHADWRVFVRTPLQKLVHDILKKESVFDAQVGVGARHLDIKSVKRYTDQVLIGVDIIPMTQPD